MEKHNTDAKNKSNREAGRSEHSRKRLQEPLKFYSKNYLKRYNHGESRTTQQQQPPLSPPLLPSPPPTPMNPTPGKKNSTTDQIPALANRSQQKEPENNPAIITISSTILKLEKEGEAISSKRESTSSVVEISKNENSINPYNNSQYARESSRFRHPSEQDYRYSLVNAMSSIKSSYFKCAAADTVCDESADESRVSISGEDESLCAEWSKSEIFKKIKTKVEEAIKRHKIFLIRGELPRLKEALEERGWIQKYEPSRTRSLPYGSAPSLEAKSLGDVRLADGTPNERALTYALLRHVQPDFIWDCRNDFAEWDRSIAGSVLLNRLQKPSLYTSKLGMAHVLQEAHWLHETDVADVLYPRSYNPTREQAALVQDFRRCAALAVLRRFVDRMRNAELETNACERQVEKSEENEQPRISLDRIEFAVRCCEEQIAELKHEDIDTEVDSSEISEEEWRLFYEDCERMLYKAEGMANLPKSDPYRLEACYEAAKSTLEKLKNMDPQFELNGEKNIWIVKPSNLCCGSGIFMTHDLKTILRKVESKPRDYYVVQKYIERPFLVYGTKFDIRQWFLVTSTFPMTIWLFKEALLRLSSKPYTFATYHEAIHLCNTAVQERYDYERRKRRNCCASGIAGPIGEELTEPSVRDQGWDCRKLNEYLKNEGYEGEPYYEKIYPKMSQAIVLTMLAAQDFMDRRRCSFELYGADFMVMEDLSVWLIEINTNPRMHPPSSRITQRLYDSVLDSLVKVIMDVPLNPNAYTGGFELAYRQPVPESQPYLGPCLFAFGKSMILHEPSAKKKQLITTCIGPSTGGVNVGSFCAKSYRAWTAPPTIERLREPKVVDFIAYLNNVPVVESSYIREEPDEEE